MKKNVLLLAALLTAPMLAESGNYTIIEDDNLWNLSGTHLGDPTAWEQIWGENSQINNPDLIHTGDIIRIPDYQGQIGAASELEVPIAIKKDTPVTFADRISGLEKTQEVKSDISISDEIHQDKKSSLNSYLHNNADLYSKAVLRSAPYILSDNNSTNADLTPGMGSIQDNSQQMYGLNTVVTVVADKGFTFNEGERYDFSQSVKFMTHNSKSVNVIRPAGSGIVISSFADSARIRVTDSWHVIRDGARVQPYRDFPQLKNPKVTTDVGIAETNLLTRIDASVALKMYEILILDGGLDADLAPGDLMSAARIDAQGNEEHEATLHGIVLTVNDNSAALIVQEIHKYAGNSQYHFKRYGRLIFEK